MENQLSPSDWNGDVGSASEGQWQDTIQLLKLVQSDYQGVRRQLDQVGNNLVERENLVDQRLQYALQVSRGYQPLRLVPYDTGTLVGRIGKTVLGELFQPKVLPEEIRLEIHCLGRFEISCSQKQVLHWHSVKAKSVFQYLLTNSKQPIVKEVLMEMLWPDCAPRVASNNLKAAIHGLRRTLNDLFENKRGFPCLLFLQGSYMINPEIDLWVDVEEFQQHWTLGHRFEKEGKLSQAIQEYEKAEALYMGDYLGDEPYEEWTLLRREALIDNYLLILGKLADYSIKMGDYDSCITYSQKILAKDPCREDAYRRLMYCYRQLGHRNRALRWYEICRRTVQTELDATPDPETSALYHKLLKNEPL
ncbi:BTAD domain-containing putative transcriptional regulator [Chloroflexota bacterium]